MSDEWVEGSNNGSVWFKIERTAAPQYMYSRTAKQIGGSVKYSFVNGFEILRETNAINPPYYVDLKPEPLDVIEAWQLPFHLGAALKYIARAGKKDPTKTKEDIQKAITYLQRYVDKVLK